jgi:hypothetical protein
MPQAEKNTAKKVYAQPELEKRERLSEVTEGGASTISRSPQPSW